MYLERNRSYRAVMAMLLQSSPPLDVSNRRVGLPAKGLDCLVRVIRIYYSTQVTLSDDAFTSEIRQQEKDNPVLEYAWQDFEQYGRGPTDELKNKHAEAKKSILLAMGLTEHSPPEAFTFLSLARSDIMNNTLWSRPQFRLYTRGLETVVDPGSGSTLWQVKES